MPRILWIPLQLIQRRKGTPDDSKHLPNTFKDFLVGIAIIALAAIQSCNKTGNV